MAGFEVIVRPVIFPNIRPAPARSIAPDDDPERGVAVLSGSGGKLIDLTQSEQQSMSRSHAVETKRRFDKVRTYQKEDDGTINRDHYVDTEVVNKLWMDGPGPGENVSGGTPGTGNSLTASEIEEFWRFQELEPADNIEILEKDQIRKNPAR